MINPKFLLAGITASALSLCTTFAYPPAPTQIPSFTNVSVHDPSVIKDGSSYYIFGSFLASASTTDLMNWTLITDGWDATTNPTNALIQGGSPQTQFAAALAYAHLPTDTTASTFWAPDVIKLGDGRYYLYYCVCNGTSRAALGLAVANSITGPYANVNIMLESGMWGLPSPDGTIYNNAVHPNVVDPSVFFDHTGKLWMVYGSYSGGIFILSLDPSTGQPYTGQAYGKKLIGGNNCRIEGSYIIYSPETDYYYMFFTFGGLDTAGGYNIRYGRSHNPDGPYLDAAGNDLTNVKGAPNTVFDDASIAPYAVKLMGNYEFLAVDGEPSATTRGYVSPGGTSVHYDPHTHQYFLVFHTRFVGRGEEHEVRVHQLYMNAHGWLVAAPQRYAGETLQRHDRDDVPGDYKIINHGKDITATVKTSSLVSLQPDGSITGASTGTWRLNHRNDITLTLDGETYSGVLSTQWDDDQNAWVYAFSALSTDGVALWGSHAVTSPHPVHTFSLPERLALYGETMAYTLPKPCECPNDVYSYSVISGPSGLSIDRATGVLSWTPTLLQVDVPYPVTILALNTSPENPQQTHYAFTLTARSVNVVKRVDLSFSSAASVGLQDVSGVFAGFTTRLPGTGSALPVFDPNLKFNAATSSLDLSTTQSDFNGQNNLAIASMPGVKLSDLGFTGTEDFAATVAFRPITTLQFIDQVGLYVGANSNLVTRADTIVFASTERHSTHTQNGFDYDGHFFGFGLDISSGMNITITRATGVWHYYINSLEWNPLSAPTFLDGRSDLVAGVFAVTPLNTNKKTIEVASYSLVVATNVPQLTPLEAWRIRYFGTLDNKGIAADWADPDHDGFTNLQEFEAGTDPLDDTSHPPYQGRHH